MGLKARPKNERRKSPLSGTVLPRRLCTRTNRAGGNDGHHPIHLICKRRLAGTFC